MSDLGIKYAVERVSCVSFPPGIVATFLQEDKPEVLDGPREWVFDPIGWVRVVVAMDCNYGAFDAPHDFKQVPAAPKPAGFIPDSPVYINIELDFVAFVRQQVK
ncbi:unnamed protein product [marine sediment metagenome]|uniref:Uncharacterized protein n=1 Tax=marine sediment metagenome TaxID=412755 RepID=X1M957_9ZZZZ